MRTTKNTMLLGSLALAALAGCGRNAVRASEKEFLADRVMIFDNNGQAAAADTHINTNREGAAGIQRGVRVAQRGRTLP